MYTYTSPTLFSEDISRTQKHRTLIAFIEKYPD